MKVQDNRYPGRPEEQLSKNERIKLHNEKRKKQKRRRNALSVILVLMTAVAVVVILSLTVFFRIESIRIEGITRYTNEQIASASGIKNGDGILLLRASDTEKNIVKSLVYIGKVEVKKQLSGVITLHVTETEPKYYIATDAGNILFDTTGKVLEYPAASVPIGCAEVKGIKAPLAEPGSPVAAEDDPDYRLFLTIKQQCVAAGIGSITEIDIRDEYDICVTYANRCIIKLGNRLQLEDKLLAAVEIIKKESDTNNTIRMTIIDVSDANKAFVRNAEHTTAAPPDITSVEPESDPNVDSASADG